jgi:dienelactone hydrolase
LSLVSTNRAADFLLHRGSQSLGGRGPWWEARVSWYCVAARRQSLADVRPAPSLESEIRSMSGKRESFRFRSPLGFMALIGMLASPGVSGAEIIEQTVSVPVQVRAPDGAQVRQTIAVTIVRESSAGRRPFLVLHHGRGATPAERTAMGLQNYPANSRYFAANGFVVLMPTRVGYGVSGGPDVENTGPCSRKRFAEGAAPAVSETRQVLSYATHLDYVDPDRGIVVGESFGGVVAIAIAASDIRGVLAVVNISGGDGGDAVRRTDEPCQADRMRDTFARYGEANRLPTLWMYSANNRLWGRIYPKQWFAAFVDSGGRGQFVELPADKNNGHFIFNRNALAWHPAFEGFVAQLDLAGAKR